VAAPLFSEAERRFNARLKRRLSRHFDVFLPQNDGGLLVDLLAQGHSVAAAAAYVSRLDCEAIENSHLVLAVLDGRTVDEGVAFELGFATALRKPCFGLQTDPRRLLPSGNNPLIDTSCRRVFASVDAFLMWHLAAASSYDDGNPAS
jgi:nucleoside 2-deoxyribosyltransferase